MRSRPVVLVSAAACLLLYAAPASAHAALQSTSPTDGEQLDAPPTEVTLTFTEAVDPPEGAIRVFTADGERVDEGPRERPDPTVVGVVLPDDLLEGSYVVT